MGWLNLPHRKAAYDACSKIISLKKMYPTAFMQGNYNMQVAQSDWANGKRIALTHSDLNMVALGNFQSTNTVTTYPSFQKAGKWYDLLTGDSIDITNTNLTIDLQAGELKIYTDKKIINSTNEVINPVIDKEVTIYPTITSDKVYISSTNKIEKISLYNLQGTLIKAFQPTINEIDVANLQGGVYLLDIQTIKGKNAYKIVKF